MLFWLVKEILVTKLIVKSTTYKSLSKLKWSTCLKSSLKPIKISKLIFKIQFNSSLRPEKLIFKPKIN